MAKRPVIRRWLAEPRLKGVDVDDQALIDRHREILASKPLTRHVFTELYRACLDAEERYLSGKGIRLEIGAGSSFFKTLCPDLLTSDVKAARGMDLVVDAMAMPFGSRSVRSIFGIHVFHHLSDPDAFFRELQRVLVRGGGCVLVEPYYGPLATFAYRRLFTTEGFDAAQPDWRTSITGPMAGANQALSFVVLVRDRAEFLRRYPEMEIVEQRPLENWLRYLLSGGVNFRTLAPTSSERALEGFETALSPLVRWLALHHVIVMRKRV